MIGFPYEGPGARFDVASTVPDLTAPRITVVLPSIPVEADRRDLSRPVLVAAQ